MHKAAFTYFLKEKKLLIKKGKRLLEKERVICG